MDFAQYGRTIVEDNKAFLALDCGEVILLNNSFKIEVLNLDHYEIVTLDQLLNLKDQSTGWNLLAGLDARIKLKEVA